MGKNTDVLRSRDMDCFSSERAFSIIYSEQYNTMDLIADTADEANIWVTGLTCLLSKNRRGKLNIHPDHTSGYFKKIFKFCCCFFSEQTDEHQRLRDQYPSLKVVDWYNLLRLPSQFLFVVNLNDPSPTLHLLS